MLDALKQLEKDGFAVTLVEPDETGRVPPEAIETALRPDTLLVSLMLANNEIGVLNDVAAVAELVAARGVLLHTDASQMVGKLPVDVRRLGVDFLSLTAHKFYGPKGIGALFVRESARPRIAPLQFGGGHERGLRAGTLPTHQIAGLGAPPRWRASRVRRCRACARPGRAPAARARDHPRCAVQHRHPEGVPGLINASFEGVEGESLVTGLAGDRRIHRLRLQLGDARTQLRLAGPGAQHGAGAKLAAACRWVVSRPRAMSTPPPPRSATKSRGCGPGGRARRSLRRGRVDGSQLAMGNTCWGAR